MDTILSPILSYYLYEILTKIRSNHMNPLCSTSMTESRKYDKGKSEKICEYLGATKKYGVTNTIRCSLRCLKHT